MPGSTTPKIRALVHAWLLLDFFGEARRQGGGASTLTTTIFSQSFLALVVAALLYPEPPPVPFAAANLCLSTLLVALGACEIEPQAVRARADRLLLGTAPVGALVAVAARAAHGTFHIGLATVGMALPPAILLACREHTLWLAPAYVLLACVCAGIATGALAVVLRAGRLALGIRRTALLAGTLKALLLGLGLVLFVLSLPSLQKDASALPVGRTGAELLPPYHAARLLAHPFEEAWRGLVLLGTLAVLLAAAVRLGERQRLRPARVRPAGPLQRLVLRAAGSAGPERAVASFTATMLWRSPGLRARVLPLLGVPAAMAFLALHGSETRGRALLATMALQFPAIYLPIVIAFLPRADQPGCRWVFDTAPARDPARMRRAVWLALWFALLLPVQVAVLAALLLAGLAPLVALPAGAFAIGAGGIAARTMVADLGDLPFSRDGDDGAELQLGNLLGYGLLLAGAGAGAALLPPGLAAAAALTLLVAVAALARPPR